MTDERGGRYFREARFFLAGDSRTAQSHIPEARSLMGHMRDMQALGGPAIQVKYSTLQDGTQIKARMMNGQYQAVITSPGLVRSVVPRAFRGGIICRPCATYPSGTPLAANGWGEPFTYDSDGHTTAGTAGGAHPHVIFDPNETGMTKRWPEIQQAYPKLTVDPVYSQRIGYGGYWRSENFDYVWSWNEDYLVYHRGKQVRNMYADIPGTSTVPARISAVGEWTEYPDADSTVVVLFVLVRHTSLVSGVRTRLMRYVGTRSGDGDGVSFSSVSTVWTSSSAYLPSNERGVFNLAGSRCVLWEGGDAGDGPVPTISVLDIADALTVTPTSYPTPSDAELLVWRGDAPCVLRELLERSEQVNLDTSAVTTLFSGSYVDDGGEGNYVRSVFTAILAADLWEDKYVVRMGERESILTQPDLVAIGSWSWTLAFVVGGVTYPFLHDENNPPLAYWATSTFESSMWHRFIDSGEMLDNNCTSSLSIHASCYAAFGPDDILVSMYTAYDTDASPINLLNRSMWYFDGENTHNAADLLGVDHLTNLTDCGGTGRFGSFFHFIGLI